MAMGPSANNISSQPLHAAGLRTAAEGAALWIGIGRWGRALGGDRVLGRDLQADRRRAAGLPGRRDQPHRHRPSPKSPRRTPALGLSDHTRPQGGGLKNRTPLTENRLLPDREPLGKLRGERAGGGKGSP